MDVYKRPYDPKRPVICLDETSKQLICEQRQPITTSNGTILYDYQYKREGVRDIYLVCEPLVGQRYVTIRDNHDRLDWATVVADTVENKYERHNKSLWCKITYRLINPAQCMNYLSQNGPEGSWIRSNLSTPLSTAVG